MKIKRFYILFFLLIFSIQAKASDTLKVKQSYYLYGELSHSFSSHGDARDVINNHSQGSSSSHSGTIYEPKQDIKSLARTSVALGLNTLVAKSKSGKTEVFFGLGFQYSLYRTGVAFFNDQNTAQKRNVIFNLQQIAFPMQLEFRANHIPFHPNISFGVNIAKNMTPSYSLSGDHLENSFYISTGSSTTFKKVFLYPSINVGLSLLEKGNHHLRFQYKYENLNFLTTGTYLAITRKKTDLTTQSSFTPHSQFHNICLNYSFRIK